MLHRRLTACAAALAAAALAAGSVTAASAATRPMISASSSGVHPHLASDYLAGYQTSQVGISHAAASFTVPAMTCPTSDSQGTAVGIGNEQTQGLPTVLAIVFLACIGGSPYLLSQVSAGTEGNVQQGAVNAGDKIKVAINQAPHLVTATLTDVTQASTIRVAGTPYPDNTLTYGSFPLFSGAILPVADFGSVVVSKPILENTTLGAWSPTRLVRKSGSTAEVNTSGFFAGGGFRLNFLAN